MAPPLKIPPELKKITQFVRRAEELDRDVSRPQSRLVAYYCRQHAVKTGIRLSNSPAATECLGSLLTGLECEQEAVGVFSPTESRFVCRNFALQVFDRADGADRAGGSDRSTAKTFYAAAVFLEVLQHFGEEMGEEETGESREEETNKRVYAKWKATEILKALKEGRPVQPGGYNENANSEGGQQEEQDDEKEGQAPKVTQDHTHTSNDTTDHDDDEAVRNTTSNDNTDCDDDIPASPSAPPTNTSNNSEVLPDQGTEVDMYGPPPPYYDNTDNDDNTTNTTNNAISSDDLPPPLALPSPLESAPSPTNKKNSIFQKAFGSKKQLKPKHKPSGAALSDATELARFALAALEHGDAELGATRLQQALESLSGE